MSSPLVFVRDGRTLPFIPVTVAALAAIRTRVPKGRPYAVATYMALLEFANEDRTDRIAVSQRDLLERAGVSRSTVQAALANLQTAGVLEVRERIHGNARIENEYVVVEPSATDDTPAREKGDPRPSEKQRTLEVRQEEQPSLSENGLEAGPGISSLGSLDAQLVARKQDSAEIVSGEVVEMKPPPTKLFGKPAPASLVRDAVAALNCYCEQTGQQIRPYTARGKPSDSLTRIMRAMADHPEIQVIYRRMIEHTLISRWWGHDDPHVGVIFGPGVVQQSIQRAHRKPSPRTNGRLLPGGEALRAIREARLADTGAIG